MSNIPSHNTPKNEQQNRNNPSKLRVNDPKKDSTKMATPSTGKPSDASKKSCA
jgi:hypothetical protein